MSEFIANSYDKPKNRQLRKGWSTGACATAAVKAAYTALITRKFEDTVTITLPRGEKVSFGLELAEMDQDISTVAIVKDAGDDPDVTHGATIQASVRIDNSISGISFCAGKGVGTVTLPGLALDIGEPAINPVPRRMMTQVIEELAILYGEPGNVEITISVVNGEKLADYTMNARLGIMGGLSILGTTGIVTPYSCAAWIASIHRGVDVAEAADITHIVGATGKLSEASIQRFYKLDDKSLLEMGDFAGALIKYLRKKNFTKFTIAGGFAKIAKLSQGNMDLHSGRSQLDMVSLASNLENNGAPTSLIKEAYDAKSAASLLACSGKYPLAEVIAKQALDVVRSKLQRLDIDVDIVIFDRSGKLIGHAT